MAMAYTILYYCHDTMLSDLSREECAIYRRHAQRHLDREFPEHHIVIDRDTEYSKNIVFTNDNDGRQFITDYCLALFEEFYKNCKNS